jgi:GNAT superfamily N-acetyltransferase
LVRDRDTAIFIGRLDGRAAATSIAVRTGEVSGVYAVGTVEDARRRGLGTAVTWACIDAARAWGSDAVVLQASEMGLPLYRAMGFETVVQYARFGPREEGAPS